MDNLYGFYPAKILSYNSSAKTVQVSIEPYTNGSENGITAKLAYPVGFDDLYTELNIEGNPDVWVFFEKGQFKNPIVSFFRTHQVNSTTGVFRLKHKRIEFTAEEVAFFGKVTATETITSAKDILAGGGGVSLMEHPHGGVQTGGGQTSKPIVGGNSSSSGGTDNGSNDTSGGSNDTNNGSNDTSSGSNDTNNGSNNTSSGTSGKDGLSAYELAVKEGYSGSQQEWLASLHGKDGKNGSDGKSILDLAAAAGIATSLAGLMATLAGSSGKDGAKGEKGDAGTAGKNGLSAFQSAVQDGFLGTESEWIESLHGNDAVIDLYTEQGKQSTGRLKMWTGQINTNGAWVCDYSSANFVTRPMIWGNVQAAQSSAGQRIFLSIDTEDANNKQCSGTILSNDDQSQSIDSIVYIYALGI